jgi:hypothetical protein
MATLLTTKPPDHDQHRNARGEEAEAFRLCRLRPGVICPSSRLVPPPATTSRTLMDSSRRTGAAIADDRPEVVTLRDLIEREGEGTLREPEGIGNPLPRNPA